MSLLCNTVVVCICVCVCKKQNYWKKKMYWKKDKKSVTWKKMLKSRLHFKKIANFTGK